MRAAPRVWLGLDFDGTLSRHVARPDDASLPAEVRGVLAELAAGPRTAVAVITGRALRDIVPRVGITGVAYAGNHGLEVEAAGLSFRDPVAVAARPALAAAWERIRDEFHGAADVVTADKELTLSVDYFGVDEARRAEVVRRIDAAARGRPELRVRHARHGSEIRPATPRHKGTAAVELWRHQARADSLPIYLGDSGTDEDAFTALPDGVTVRVGPGDTAARYRVDSPDDVWEVLRRIRSLAE